jgi:hypothetical protein
MTIGTCKLTGTVGPLIKSHLLPKALSVVSQGSNVLATVSNHERAKRAQMGWYDKTIVTAEGEAILARYDDYGISVLRRNRLTLKSRDGQPYEKDVGIGLLEVSDPPLFRLFALSLLWRAVATSNVVFREGFKFSSKNWEPLSRMVRSGDAERATKFPVMVCAFSDPIGGMNWSPRDVRFVGSTWVRFYLDGALVYVMPRYKNHFLKPMGTMLIGSQSRQAGLVFPWGGSPLDRHSEEMLSNNFERLGEPTFWSKNQ